MSATWAQESIAASMHTHPFNGPLSGTTQVSRYQKGKTNLDFTEARDSECSLIRPQVVMVCCKIKSHLQKNQEIKTMISSNVVPMHQTLSRHTSSLAQPLQFIRMASKQPHILQA